jgi:hypothetical protein
MGQALRLVVAGQMPRQRDLDLGPDPAPHPVAPHQHDERGTAVQGLFEARHPALARAVAVLVPIDAAARLLQGGLKNDARVPVRTAVAQEDRLGLHDCHRRHAGEGCAGFHELATRRG